MHARESALHPELNGELKGLSSREGHDEMESSRVCVENCPGQNKIKFPTEWT